ncbi:hypothetical protein MMC12_006537 [Toensbergia leucococca]|nr:hypothetical protein [Toensbergia leucococca]
MLFGDTQTAEKIVLATAPAAQKSLGRQVKCLREDVWDLNKEKIVEEGNWNKFRDAEDNTGLRRMLLGTGDRELVEASPGDKVWGIGYKAHDAEANRDKWGGNLLGKALMRVRSRLQELDGPKCNF